MQAKAGSDLEVTQDEDNNNDMHVWRKFDAAKDDIYVIDKEGKIALFFAKPDSDLNKENVKMGLKNVLESGSPCS